MCSALSSRIVENCDTENFGNSFFEQLKSLTAKFTAKVCDTGDVAAGTGKIFNEACFNRIGPHANHNDGNRLGCILGRPDLWIPSRYDDDINLETHQVARKLGQPIELTLRVAILEGNVLSFYVAKIAQCQPNWFGTS